MQHPHLVVDITGHGYGHLSQTAPVIRQLLTVIPTIKITVRSSLDQTLVLSFIGNKELNRIHFSPPGPDFGMQMHDALTVDSNKSLQHYQFLHQNWPEKVNQEATNLVSLEPDLVLSNISYLTLAASAQLNIPCVALCSLDWASIFNAYCSDMPGSSEILATMQESYQLAEAFLQPRPHLPMTYLENAKPIAPISGPTTDKTKKLRQQLKITTNQKLVLVNMGGMPLDISTDMLPLMNNVIWLIKKPDNASRPDIVDIDELAFEFSELLASVDLIVSKTGYGMVVQAAYAQTPILYIERGNWPEEDHLWPWCCEHNDCERISLKEFKSKELIRKVKNILDINSVSVSPKRLKRGEVEAADYLVNLLKEKN